jgi:hypothetical protein
MFGKFCLRVTVGIGVFLLFGGENAGELLAMAVICTLGLGLIVIIPAAYLIGLVCTIWFVPFGNRSKNAVEKQPRDRTWAGSPETGKSHTLAELESLRVFVDAADAKGRDWQSIRNELLAAGWDSVTVERVRGCAGIVNGIDR